MACPRSAQHDRSGRAHLRPRISDSALHYFKAVSSYRLLVKQQNTALEMDSEGALWFSKL